ncbi:MAG TPA: ORF6N domain-containing protein [Chitinophagaceae bacterium]
MKVTIIQKKIFVIRDEKVMLDFDLAALYGVETRALNQAVKRNRASFPKDFMFRLTAKEWKQISSSELHMRQTAGSKKNSSQFVMSSKRHRGKTYMPYAFTEHGVSMLASVLKSTKARKMNMPLLL